MAFESMNPGGPLRGSVRVPGDKSISHRAVLFAAMAEGISKLTGVLDSADVRSTIAAVRTLGAEVVVIEGDNGGLDVSVVGWGATGPHLRPAPIDCGNSGTTVRLLMGALAGKRGLHATFTGDESLSRRPMRRVTGPLTDMGASFADADGHLPVELEGAILRPMDYHTPVPSAQVKTAVLLAGLDAHGETCVTESAPSRDHTERMLPVFGVPVTRHPETHTACVHGAQTLSAASIAVPADPSSAAFLACAAAIAPNSEVTLPEVALNPTRTGFLEVLRRMGASIEIDASDGAFAEEVGSIRVTYVPELKATTVTAEEIPSLVDEIPILAVVATQVSGTTRFEGVGELRVKESDRLAAIADALGAMGGRVDVDGDTLFVTGPTPLHAASVDSLGDHRLAMAWAVAGLCMPLGESVAIERFESVEVSYPGFVQDLERLGA